MSKVTDRKLRELPAPARTAVGKTEGRAELRKKLYVPKGDGMTGPKRSLPSVGAAVAESLADPALMDLLRKRLGRPAEGADVVRREPRPPVGPPDEGGGFIGKDPLPPVGPPDEGGGRIGKDPLPPVGPPDEGGGRIGKDPLPPVGPPDEGGGFIGKDPLPPVGPPDEGGGRIGKDPLPPVGPRGPRHLRFTPED